jgi:hypothetical protein
MKVSEALRAADERMAEVGHFQRRRDGVDFDRQHGHGGRTCIVRAVHDVSLGHVSLYRWTPYVDAVLETDYHHPGCCIVHWSDYAEDEDAILCLKRAAELAEADGQ